jgi:hypothetical protein
MEDQEQVKKFATEIGELLDRQGDDVRVVVFLEAGEWVGMRTHGHDDNDMEAIVEVLGYIRSLFRQQFGKELLIFDIDAEIDGLEVGPQQHIGEEGHAG